MNAGDLPLMLASGFTRVGPEPYPLDRVRMQKAVFLITQRGTPRLRELYEYRPYNWGPYSDALAQDVRALEATGRMAVEAAPGSRYGRYVTTVVGEAHVIPVWNDLEPGERAFVANVRRYVTASSFNKLLREVYAEYPEFATASQFRG